MAIVIHSCPECTAQIKIKMVLNDKDAATYYLECPCCGYRTGLYGKVDAAIKVHNMICESLNLYKEQVKKSKNTQELISKLQKYQVKDITKDITDVISSSDNKEKDNKKAKVIVATNCHQSSKQEPVKEKKKRVRRTKEQLAQDPVYLAKKQQTENATKQKPKRRKIS